MDIFRIFMNILSWYLNFKSPSCIFCTFFPAENDFSVFRIFNSTGGWIPGLDWAHTSDEQEPLRREGARNPAVGFPSKNGGDFLMGFWWVEMCGVGKWRKTRSFGFFCFGEKWKDCDKKGVLETLLPAIGSNMIHLQYFIRLLYSTGFIFTIILSHITTVIPHLEILCFNLRVFIWRHFLVETPSSLP